MEGSDDDYYDSASGSGDCAYDDEHSDEEHVQEDHAAIEPVEARKAPFAIMDWEELRERQQRCVEDATELLDMTQEASYVLLRKHGWDLERLQEAWFEDSERVLERCGLGQEHTSEPAVSSSFQAASGPQRCRICLEEMEEPLLGLDCGHGFCTECWTGFLHSQVDEGKAAVQTRCPQFKCGRMVPASFFRELCDEPRQKKYEEWYVLSYVDDNPSVKWCTNPAGCKNAAEYRNVDAADIRCSCGFVRCWTCDEEAHRPADCETVSQWSIKNSAESENISWIRANTKNCPKCHKPIEKNQGCNHMICPKAGGCGYDFCWLCLGEWSKHGTATGGYYQCNIYDKQAKDGKHVEEEQTRAQAKHSLDKYIFFFERFMNHDRGTKLTVTQEDETDNKVRTLHDKYGFEVIELQFLYDALRQVRACRRVLKWSYVYGYYLEDAGPEKNLFEHLQKHLEEKTDCLHEMLERDFEQFFDSEEALSTEEQKTKFMEFRSHVTNYTNVTQKFLKQILTDLGSAGKLTDCS